MPALLTRSAPHSWCPNTQLLTALVPHSPTAVLDQTQAFLRHLSNLHIRLSSWPHTLEHRLHFWPPGLLPPPFTTEGGPSLAAPLNMLFHVQLSSHIPKWFLGFYSDGSILIIKGHTHVTQAGPPGRHFLLATKTGSGMNMEPVRVKEAFVGIFTRDSLNKPDPS